MRPKTLTIAITVFVMLAIANSIYLQTEVSKINPARGLEKTTAYAIGNARLCLNNQPTNLSWPCSQSIPNRVKYTCQLSAIDDNNTLTFSSSFLAPPTLFTVSSSGLFNFTPNNSYVGSHTVRVLVDDGTGCNNSQSYADFNLSIYQTNSPPYLATIIPNQSLSAGTSFVFFLNDHFEDFDNDTLTYISGGFNSSMISITIANNSQVTLKGLNCGSTFAYYVATDPDGETNTSNNVLYTFTDCSTTAATSSSSEGEGGGGGLSCTPLWRCGKWGRCQNTNQSVLECKDYSSCGNNAINTFYRNCTYVPEQQQCTSQWECGTWSDCINNVQTRECIDKNQCSIPSTKPERAQSCTLQSTCLNGVLDNGEEGIDCGGVCNKCKIVEQPAQPIIPPNMTLLIVIAVSVLLLVGAQYMFRKQIKKAIAHLLAPREYEKKMLIDDTQKEKLLRLWFFAQSNYEEAKYTLALSSISEYVREFFKYLLKIERIQREVFIARVAQFKDKNLEKIFIELYGKIVRVETDKNQYLQPLAIQALLDELLSDLYLVCAFTEKDAILTTKERILDQGAGTDLCYNIISNTYIALTFDQIKEAKKLYASLLTHYEQLSLLEKQAVYQDILRLYNALQYSQEFHAG